MADLSYDSYLNSNKKTTNKSNKLSYDSYTKSQQPKTGILNKVGEFAKELVKDAAGTLVVKPTVRATEAITRVLAPNSLATKGYEAMADEGKGQDINIPKIGNYNVSTVKPIGQGGGKQIGGEALKSAAYLASFTKPVSKFLKTAPLAKQVAYGVGEGAAFGAGGAMEAGLDNKEILKQTALGGALGGVAPIAIKGISKLLSKSTPKITKEITDNLPDEKVARDLHSWTTGLSKNGELPQDTISKLRTNKIGVDELPTNKDGTITLFRSGEVTPGKTQSYSSQRIDPNQVEVKVPKENVLANLNSSKVDDLYNKSFTKQEIDAGYLDQRKLNKFEKEVIATSPENKVINTQPLEVKSIKQPEQVLDNVPELKNLDPEVKTTTFKEIRDNYDNLAKTSSVNDLIDISMGKKEVPQGLTKTSIYELTKNRKDLTLEQIKRLKNIAPESEAGLNLVTVKLRDGGLVDNPTDFIQATEKVMKENVKKSGITSKTINRFFDGLECK